ncbi:polysaccharide pyruvyl transferase family protein [Oceanobacillus kimchii]|uniref:polysaccharide pyruvyl transferase family protein n=1 Tax=Oceanobacillus kimchii TaxID=746691 RepID=UPI0021A2811A|nr:polysaccharide pyruvyl transferase family protein [Oceanobacillus kimchii]MCT1579229.1 polysaccharide pyruvyl transferase family protein [Oceanobacillus kimchii]MCT2134639.1 polysaccharide pyruvyl transferase family protein [Oceanobacillus kimchii]
MKNILIRSNLSPFDTFDATKVILENSIGGNVGNLVYQYSVFRTFLKENTTITPDYYDFNPSRADEINEKYDCYVIPLADAFRQSFVPSLRKYTQLIKKLKIPVVVIGVGLRAPFEPDLNKGFDFDNDVKNFVSAVLEKSNMIGLRGEITSDYLSQLGFKEGVDHTVIGCPSMYTFGRELNIRNTSITKDSMVTVNSSPLSPRHVHDFIHRGMKEYSNHYFIPQWKKELLMTYVGAPSVRDDNTKYPQKMSDKVYMENRVRYFLNVKTWIDFIKKADLSFGARLHGNITATISGTPSLIIPKDARMRELTNYHGLTHIWAGDITEDTKLSDVIEKSDFHSPEKKQAQNFDHFIDFLNKNNLDHIYKETNNPAHIPFDKQLALVDHQSPVHPISGCSVEEMVTRWERYYPAANIKQDQQLKNQQKKIKKLEGNLNRKSVRATLKAANFIAEMKRK